ncbi:MAG: hypothetical protein ACW97V_10845 [Promethearchaeota archaeon]
MKRERKDKWNKQKLYSVLVGVLLIVLTILIPGARADTAILPTRGNPAMAYDSESEKIIIFSGWNISSTTLTNRDTWILHLFRTEEQKQAWPMIH